MPESIIVYRSRSEQVQDEFWWNLVETYPTFFVGMFWTLFAIAIMLNVYNLSRRWFPKRFR